MAFFQEAFVREINRFLHQRHQKLGMALGKVSAPSEPQRLADDAPLRHDLELMMDVANGKYTRGQTPPARLHEVEEALNRVVELLFGNLLRTPINIPDDFWSTDAGVLVSRVRWWLSPDELITISNAAALAFGE